MASDRPAESATGTQRHRMSAGAHAPAGPPVWLTSFVGRQAELVRIGELLRSTRLLTLTGAGGSGKTRLAAHLVGVESTWFADGIRWVDLGPIADPAQVVEQARPAMVRCQARVVGDRERDKACRPRSRGIGHAHLAWPAVVEPRRGVP